MPLIKDVLAKKGDDIATVAPQATVMEAASLMSRRRIGALCVVEGESLVGIFTERDILNRVVTAGLDPGETKIATVMTSDVTTCGLQGNVGDCAAVMSHKRVRHLPVIDDDKLVGMISTGDLMAMEMSEKQAHIEDLYEYLYGRT